LHWRFWRRDNPGQWDKYGYLHHTNTGLPNNFIQNENSKAMSCLPVHQTTSYLTTK
jgi:hypothetical protein